MCRKCSLNFIFIPSFRWVLLVPIVVALPTSQDAARRTSRVVSLVTPPAAATGRAAIHCQEAHGLGIVGILGNPNHSRITVSRGTIHE